MDPVVSPVFAGLLVQAASRVYDSLADYIQTPMKLDLEALQIIVEDAVSSWLRELPMASKVDASIVSALERVVVSDDFAYLAADSFALHILDGGQSSTVTERRLGQMLRAYGISPTESLELSVLITKFFRSVFRDIAASPKISPNRRGVSNTRRAQESARERAAAFEHVKSRLAGQMLEHLAAIAVALDPGEVSISALEQKLEALRTVTSRTHSKISPPTLSSTSIPRTYEEVYVSPDLVVGTDDRDARLSSLGMLESTGRCVILGTPGAGKTTLLNNLAYLASTSESVRNTRACILVVLREHTSSTITGRGMSIARAIVDTSADRYQVGLTEAEVLFACSTGRLLVLIDGLDEVLSLQTRQAVATAINNFATLWDRTPIAATSRIVGYSLAALDETLFSIASISPFTYEQIEQYVSKWFGLEADLAANDREILISGFLRDSEQVIDLRSNALLLSLLCGLYTTQEHLPRYRAQVYEECAKLLFRLWDERRQLRPEFNFEANIDGAVQAIAAWVFAEEGRSGGLPRASYVDTVAEYLCAWQFGKKKKREAWIAAEEFVSFCSGRAWILTDTGGADEDGHTLWGFTHRTFLEYYAALHFTEVLDRDALRALVVRHAGDSAWHMVNQLIVHLIFAKQRSLASELLLAVRDNLPLYPKEMRETAVTLLIACLRSVALRPEAVRPLVRLSLDFYLPIAGGKKKTAATGDEGHGAIWIGAQALRPSNQDVANETATKYFNRLIRRRSATGPHQGSWLDLILAVDYFSHNTSSVASIPDCIDAPRFLSDGVEQETPSALVGIACVMAGDYSVPIKGDDQDSIAMMFGTERLALSPVSGGKFLQFPNALELYVLTCSFGDDERVARVSDYLRDAVRFAMLSKDFRTRARHGWQPSWCWWRPRVPSAQLPTGLLSPSEYRLPTIVALALCEVMITHKGDRSKFIVDRLVSRDWGRLESIPLLLRQRYERPDGVATDDHDWAAWVTGEASALQFL